MGETRVDLLHLLEDLRDAYPGSLEETILTEIMANCLDSGASIITFDSDPAGSALTVMDNGSGMQRRDVARFHDIASSGKVRGQGIGFAGVGIKLGLLICEEVLTETRRGKSHVASLWRMASRHRAPWQWAGHRTRHRRAAQTAQSSIAAARPRLSRRNAPAPFSTVARSGV
jgi:Histidine kinase-, DNA gyrase B-, and HSP90-like ATPase